MQYTIYFNQKRLLLSDDKTEAATDLLQQPDTLFYKKLDTASIAEMLKEIQNPNIKAGVFFHVSAENLLQAFKEEMKVIEAGGGLVCADQETVLLIFRRGKWDLPKGKLDAGEARDAAALREVKEETGLQQLKIEQPLTVTYHTYYENGELILKESHWFLMTSPLQTAMVPQLDEGIEKCEWVKLGALAPYLENTHPSIIDVLQTGVKKLHAAQKI